MIIFALVNKKKVQQTHNVIFNLTPDDFQMSDLINARAKAYDEWCRILLSAVEVSSPYATKKQIQDILDAVITLMDHSSFSPSVESLVRIFMRSPNCLIFEQMRILLAWCEKNYCHFSPEYNLVLHACAEMILQMSMEDLCRVGYINLYMVVTSNDRALRYLHYDLYTQASIKILNVFMRAMFEFGSLDQVFSMMTSYATAMDPNDPPQLKEIFEDGRKLPIISLSRSILESAGFKFVK